MREKYYKIRKLIFFSILYKEKVLTDKATIKSGNMRWARTALQA